MGGVQVINSGLYTSNSAEWATPQKFFDVLNDEFHFTLDPCSTDENAKCKKHYTKEQDGLNQDWNGEIVYCNPPYGSGIEAWVRKCYEHSMRGGWLSCYFLHERTQVGSTTMCMEKPKSDLFGAGCGSTIASGTLRSRQS